LRQPLDELYVACAPPRSCTSEEKTSIKELQGFYAQLDAIKPDTTLEEVLVGNVAVKAAFNWAKGVIAGLAATKQTTVLYRAVGPDELADIQLVGALRNFGSAEGKYFTTSAEAAASYAKQAVKGFGDAPYTLIETRVPVSIFEGLVPATVDSGIPAWVIPTSQLRGLIPKVVDSMPIPH
jgi:hypothetical protein